MDMSQQDVREMFAKLGLSAWTVVRDSWHDDSGSNGGVYTALAPRRERAKALRGLSWDVRAGDFRPGFSQTYRDGKTLTKYEPAGKYGNFEPIVLIRNYYGAVPSQLEIVEEFRLYHNLYWDELMSQFIKPHDDGTSSAAVKIIGNRVEVRTKLLRQYQAARQLDLYFYIDSIRQGVEGEEPPAENAWSTADMRAGLFPGRRSVVGERPFTRYLGKRVLSPPIRKQAGIWPFEEEDDYFPDFVIDVDADGNEVRYTCNPDALANYFGANPDAPHYLTPVHFRREVLQKYYEKPELYTVSDGDLQCASLWNVRLDNSAAESVVVFLGDLGRDLPKQERDYWRSFNIAPEGNVSETLVRRAFLGQFADPTAEDLRVRSAYISLGRAWSEHFGWDLFRKPEEADAGLLQRLRMPLNDSQAEVEASVRILTQLLVDALNESRIQQLLPDKVLNEKGISKLQRWLTQEAYPHVDRDVKFLRDLQEVRSKMTAHRKGSEYEKTLTKVFGKLRGSAAIRTFFNSALELLAGLDEWIASRQQSDTASTAE